MKLKNYLIYPAEFISDGKGYAVTIFHESVENKHYSDDWITCGNDYSDAVEMARDCIVTWAETFFDNKIVFPKALPLKAGQIGIELPYHVALKIALRNLMMKDNVRITTLAECSQKSKQNVFNSLSLRKKTHIDTLAEYFRIAGHPLRIEVD